MEVDETFIGGKARKTTKTNVLSGSPAKAERIRPSLWVWLNVAEKSALLL